MTEIKAVIAMAGALALVAGCSQGEKVDTTPLPTVAAAPYVCDYLPRQAVERMTGLRDPVAKSSFDLNAVDGYGMGWCVVHEPDDEKSRILEVSLLAYHPTGRIEDKLSQGAKRLPEIVPGAEGYYTARQSGDEVVGAVAVLSRGPSTLTVSLSRNIEGRDPQADVMALMKLIAPRLITEASAPSPIPGKGS